MSIIKPLLLIESSALTELITQYQEFFLTLLPTVFMVAVVIEYLDRLDPFALLKRTVLSVLILVSATNYYSKTIEASFKVADQTLMEQKEKNIFLMDMLGASSKLSALQHKEKKAFNEKHNILTNAFSFMRHHFFDTFVNDAFTISTFFIAKLCFVILKVVYSAVYYLGIGLIGIPCLIYLLPTMGNVLRGAVLSYLWCLVVPHILVFIISMIGAEINHGYSSGGVIGGSIAGTAFLFVLTLFIAFTPLIGAFILNGSGISQAGGIIATVGANWIMNLPRNSVNTTASLITGKPVGPKTEIAKNIAAGGFNLAKEFKNHMSPLNKVQQSSTMQSSSGNVYQSEGPTHTNQTANFNPQTKEFNQYKRSVNNGAVSKHNHVANRHQKTTNHSVSNRSNYSNRNSSSVHVESKANPKKV